jgi:hypothetical protein
LSSPSYNQRLSIAGPCPTLQVICYISLEHILMLVL